MITLLVNIQHTYSPLKFGNFFMSMSVSMSLRLVPSTNLEIIFYHNYLLTHGDHAAVLHSYYHILS
jgi:hypothetical protein